MRDKGIRIMVLLLLLFSMAVPVQSASAASKSMKVKVTLVSAVLTETIMWAMNGIPRHLLTAKRSAKAHLWNWT
ncbi:hypothetical protein D3C73_693230 [compost metagenome]